MANRCCVVSVVLGLALAGLAGAARADVVAEEARRILDGVRRELPVVLDGRDLEKPGESGLVRSVAREVRRSAPGEGAGGRFQRILRGAPGLASVEAEYLRCVVARSLVYAAAVDDTAPVLAQAATVNCADERNGLLEALRLAAWGASESSVRHLDSPFFERAARDHLASLDAALVRMLAPRLVHARAVAALTDRRRAGKATPIGAAPFTLKPPLDGEASRLADEVSAAMRPAAR